MLYVDFKELGKFLSFLLFVYSRLCLILNFKFKSTSQCNVPCISRIGNQMRTCLYFPLTLCLESKYLCLPRHDMPSNPDNPILANRYRCALCLCPHKSHVVIGAQFCTTTITIYSIKGEIYSNPEAEVLTLFIHYYLVRAKFLLFSF